MKKVICLGTTVFLFFVLFCFTACATEPITLLEFESTSDIELKGKYSEETITAFAHPSKCVASGVSLIADKPVYGERHTRICCRPFAGQPRRQGLSKEID